MQTTWCPSKGLLWPVPSSLQEEGEVAGDSWLPGSPTHSCRPPSTASLLASGQGSSILWTPALQAFHCQWTTPRTGKGCLLIACGWGATPHPALTPRLVSQVNLSRTKWIKQRDKPPKLRSRVMRATSNPERTQAQGRQTLSCRVTALLDMQEGWLASRNVK